jgi:hypothetical protein
MRHQGSDFWLADASQPAATFRAIPSDGFPFSQADKALGLRQFHLGERVRLGVRAEYFKLFNHPNFGGPFNLRGLSGYGTIPQFGKVMPGNTLNVALGGRKIGAECSRRSPVSLQCGSVSERSGCLSRLRKVLPHRSFPRGSNVEFGPRSCGPTTGETAERAA